MRIVAKRNSVGMTESALIRIVLDHQSRFRASRKPAVVRRASLPPALQTVDRPMLTLPGTLAAFYGPAREDT